jgi:hypothetical protein
MDLIKPLAVDECDFDGDDADEMDILIFPHHTFVISPYRLVPVICSLVKMKTNRKIIYQYYSKI